jgi:hypothetical protein
MASGPSRRRTSVNAALMQKRSYRQSSRAGLQSVPMQEACVLRIADLSVFRRAHRKVLQTVRLIALPAELHPLATVAEPVAPQALLPEEVRAPVLRVPPVPDPLSAATALRAAAPIELRHAVEMTEKKAHRSAAQNADLSAEPSQVEDWPEIARAARVPQRAANSPASLAVNSVLAPVSVRVVLLGHRAATRPAVPLPRLPAGHPTVPHAVSGISRRGNALPSLHGRTSRNAGHDRLASRAMLQPVRAVAARLQDLAPTGQRAHLASTVMNALPSQGFVPGRTKILSLSTRQPVLRSGLRFSPQTMITAVARRALKLNAAPSPLAPDPAPGLVREAAQEQAGSPARADRHVHRSTAAAVPPQRHGLRPTQENAPVLTVPDRPDPARHAANSAALKGQALHRVRALEPARVETGPLAGPLPSREPDQQPDLAPSPQEGPAANRVAGPLPNRAPDPAVAQEGSPAANLAASVLAANPAAARNAANSTENAASRLRDAAFSSVPPCL